MNPIDSQSSFSSAMHATQEDKVKLTKKDDKALKKVSAEFEAILIQSMFKSMRKTLPESKLFPKSNAEKIYQEMMDSELASQVSQKQSLGLAQQIYDQMRGKINEQK